jgi:hypothetical protein
VSVDTLACPSSHARVVACADKDGRGLRNGNHDVMNITSGRGSDVITYRRIAHLSKDGSDVITYRKSDRCDPVARSPAKSVVYLREGWG